MFPDGSKEMLSGCPNCGGNKFQFSPAADTEPGTSAPSPDGRSPDDADGSTSGTSGRGDTADPDSRRDLSPDSKEWPDHGYGSTADSEVDDRGAPGGTSDADPDPDPNATDRNVTSADTDPTAAGTDAAVDPGDAGSGDSASGPVGTSTEDPAQADARTDVVSPDEIAAATPEEPDHTTNPDAPGTPATRADDGGDGAVDRPPEPRPDDRPDLDDLREELNEQFESIRIVAPGEYELNLMELYDRTEYIISLQEDGRYIIEVPDTWDTTPDPDGT